MLYGAGFRTPSAVWCHGFLTVDGHKMSKSRGTFITARTYLRHLNPEYLRYYFAAKLSSGVDDIDLNMDDFMARVNSDLVGKVVNIASRCAGFIHKRFEGRLSEHLADPLLHGEFLAARETLAGDYEGREYGHAMRRIMHLADLANQYIDEQKPWVAIKDPDRAAEVQAVCTVGLNLFRILITYLKPVLPHMASEAEAFLGEEPLGWESVERPLLGHRINPFKPLMTRVERKTVEAMTEASRESLPTTPAKARSDAQPAAIAPIAPQIGIEDFAKLDLRVARIVEAREVEGADKLLQLTLDLGQERRTVFAGIKSAYRPEDLEGRLTVMVANLAPRKMRFGVSQGMVLAAGGGSGEIYLLSPDKGARPGMRVS